MRWQELGKAPDQCQPGVCNGSAVAAGPGRKALLAPIRSGRGGAGSRLASWPACATKPASSRISLTGARIPARRSPPKKYQEVRSQAAASFPSKLLRPGGSEKPPEKELPHRTRAAAVQANTLFMLRSQRAEPSRSPPFLPHLDAANGGLEAQLLHHLPHGGQVGGAGHGPREGRPRRSAGKAAAAVPPRNFRAEFPAPLRQLSRDCACAKGSEGGGKKAGLALGGSCALPWRRRGLSQRKFKPRASERPPSSRPAPL